VKLWSYGGIERQGGYRLSTSIDGTLTGRGGDFIVVDDPLKPIDALSDSKRELSNLRATSLRARERVVQQHAPFQTR
jgi:hypothetical protein